MKPYNTIFLVACFSMLQACHSSSSTSDEGQSGSGFEVQIAELYTFTEQAKRAKSLNHRNTLWEFRGDMMLLRMAGRFEDESSKSSLALTYNNVFLQFKHVVGGKLTNISCKPKQKPEGSINRITQDDQSSSGSFHLVFEHCHETHTEQTINDLPVPLVVTGSFNNLPIKEALF